MHIARDDGFVSPESQAKIESGLKGHRHIKIHGYDGANHGFCRESDKTHFKADAANLAHERTLRLFKEELM